MTIHRKDNIEDKAKMKKILELISAISKKGWDVIFPIHPHTKKQMKSFGLRLDNIKVIEPVKYSQMLKLLSHASMLVTDSGGLQKEAYWVGTPCVTIRKSTEWIETLDGKHNVLLPSINDSAVSKVLSILEKNQKVQIRSRFFGNGHASKKIISTLLK